MPSNVETTPLSPAPQRAWWPYFVVGYVALVLLVDALATIPARIPNPYGTTTNVMGAIVAGINHVSPMPLSSLQWRPETVAHFLERLHFPAWSVGWMRWEIFARFDVFKFVFWFLVPLALCGRRVDLKAFTTFRWRKPDWYLLIAAGVLGFLAVCIIPFVPGLRDYYGGAGGSVGIPLSTKLAGLCGMMIWTFSWIIGWEFMHRYFLLQAVGPKWPRFGWLLAPFFEWAYHLQKFWLEALGMAVFSILATQYVLRRRNVSLPFIAHLLIEIALPLTLLFGALNPLTWLLPR